MGSQGREGLWQSTKELGQEHHADQRPFCRRDRSGDESVEGATDGAAFETYVKHFLAPTLKKGQVVVMDNLQVHKSLRVRELIEEAGASILFLPPYWPDFSPIEEAFSKVKNILRKAQARTHEALVEALGRALATAVSRRDALGWFEHCGYRIVDQSL
jgi:transposase